MHLCIIKALCDSSHNLIPVGTKRKFQPIAGWNDYIKTAHSDAREAFLLWQSNSQPRFGPICDIMNSYVLDSNNVCVFANPMKI